MVQELGHVDKNVNFLLSVRLFWLFIYSSIFCKKKKKLKCNMLWAEFANYYLECYLDKYNRRTLLLSSSSPAMPSMSLVSYLDAMWDGWSVAIQPYRILLPGLARNSAQHSCVVLYYFILRQFLYSKWCNDTIVLYTHMQMHAKS